MRPELIDWCENRPITIRHNRVGSFGFMLATRTVQNYYIDWGDGFVEQKQFNNYSSFSHTYTEAGTKTIIIRNLNPSEVLRFYISTSTIAVSELDVSCALKIEELRYQYCQNSFGSGLPSGILDNYKKLTNFGNGFNGFSAITTLPVDLFRYNTAITSFRYTFTNCSKLTSLPVDLFRYNTAVTDFSNTFRNCSALTSLPVDLFRYITAVTDFSNTFSGCSALTSLPVDLFRYNTAVTTLSDTFNLSSNLSGEITLPEARLCNNISYIASSTKITKINFPENFAADVSEAGVNMTGWINYCTSYTTPVSINFKLSKFTILSIVGTIPVPSIRLLNQSSTFTGSTPQVDISGVALSTEATNQLLTDLPTLTGKTIKLRTGTVCDSTIATAKGWSVIFG